MPHDLLRSSNMNRLQQATGLDNCVCRIDEHRPENSMSRRARGAGTPEAGRVEGPGLEAPSRREFGRQQIRWVNRVGGIAWQRLDQRAKRCDHAGVVCVCLSRCSVDG